MKKIFNKGINDIIYLFSPPIIYRSLIKLNSKFNKDKSDSINLKIDEMLNELQKNRFNYFFDDSIIDEFCESMRENHIDITPLPTKDKKNQQHLDNLDKNGYVVIENLFSKNFINEIREVLKPIIEKHVKILEEKRKNSDNLVSKTLIFNEGGLKIVHNIFNGVIRVWGVENLIKSINPKIINNEIINDICSSYLGNKAGDSVSCYLDIKSVTGSVDASTQPHADSIYKILKVFIPIEDIGYDNAPYLYFQGSHKPQEFKLLKDLIEFSQHSKKYSVGYTNYGLIGMFKASENFPELNIKPKLLPLNSGDIIITDTNGVHAATNLKSGRRIQLGLVFAIRGYSGEDLTSDANSLSKKLKSRNAR